MASDKQPILHDVVDLHSVDAEMSSKKKNRKRDGFNDTQVARLAIIQIGLGVISFLLGLVLEVMSFFIRCDKFCYRIPISRLGTGMWCGVVFIGCGIFGIFASKQKSTCFIVGLMAIATSTTAFAVCEVGLSIAAAVSDRGKEAVKQQDRPTDYYHRFKNYDSEDNYDITYHIPVPVFTLNILLCLLGIVVLAALVCSAVFSCCATCCHKNPAYLNVNLYEPVTMPVNNFENQMQPYVMPQGVQQQIYYAQAQQGFGSNSMQPIILIPSNQQVFGQYQNIPQSVPLQASSGADEPKAQDLSVPTT